MTPPTLHDATRYRAIFDRAAIGISVVDEHGVIVEANQAFQTFLGYTLDELVGRRAPEFSPESEAVVTREALRVLRNGEQESVTCEKQFRRKDGMLRTAILTLSRVELDTNRSGFIGMSVDVTEQRAAESARTQEAETALHESEMRYGALLETLPLVVYVVEPRPPYSPIYVSPGVSLLGYSYEEWMASPDTWTRALHADDRERVLAETQAALDAGRPVEYEYRIVAKDGSTRWVHDRGEFVYAADGTPLSWRGVMLDVTGRRQAERALAHERSFLAAVLDSLSEGIVACDRFGKLTLFNRATRELHGLPAEGFVPPEQWGAHYNTYRPESHPEAGSPMPADELPLLRALRARAGVQGIEFQVAPAGRAPRTMVANARIIRGANGEFLGAVSASRDMTEQKAVEKALRESEARVRAAVQASLDGMFICRAVRDPGGDVVDFEITDANARGAALVGITESQLLGQLASRIFPLLENAGLLNAFARVVETGVPLERELQPLDERFEAEWIRLQAVRVNDGICVSVRDITDQKKAEETLRALALVDELTGVHNRRGFMALAEREWQRAQREQRGAVLAYIDLDDFKTINDVHGHAEGDEALKCVADILRAAFRGADVIGRLGGDEFAVLVVPTGPVSADHSEIDDVERRIVERIRYHLASSNVVSHERGRGYEIAMSIGTAVVRLVGAVNDGSMSLASLMLLADERLYDQKRERDLRENAQVTQVAQVAQVA